MLAANRSRLALGLCRRYLCEVAGDHRINPLQALSELCQLDAIAVDAALYDALGQCVLGRLSLDVWQEDVFPKQVRLGTMI